jgi:tRNA (guanine-N7-)-methyltransferase
VGKNKLARFAELGTFSNVIQPGADFKPGREHQLKGKWKSDMFHNENAIILELGCGKGEYTTGLASRFPDRNFIGVDIKGARMWRGAKTAIENKLVNAAFLRTRIEFITSFFGEDEIDEIWLTFPDPFTGKRVTNRRLTCPWFLNNYRHFLKDNGIIHLKTDNSELFNYTLSVARGNNLTILYALPDLNTMKQIDDILSIKTHYENMFTKKGHSIKYLSFRINKNKIIEHDPSKETERE